MNLAPASCPACATRFDRATHEVLIASEMMFGLGDTFNFASCHRCQTLYLLNPPSDLSPFYPLDYYSLADLPAASRRSWLRRVVTRAKTRAYLGQFDPLGLLLLKITRPLMPQALRWIKLCDKDTSARVLDVGSGNGELLHQLAALGFRKLKGIDPFLSEAQQQERPFPLCKQDFADETSQQDVIVFNHSLEHMPEPAGILAHARSLLRPGGVLLVRTPVAGSTAFRTYREHWVQLDAPRHLTVFSVAGIRSLADRTGFTLYATRYDSTAMQFWGSEQYRRGIPLMADNSYFKNPAAASFTSAEIESFQQQAELLNRAGDGDQACFFLRAV